MEEKIGIILENLSLGREILTVSYSGFKLEFKMIDQ
jgi:hypothetical protein